MTEKQSNKTVFTVKALRSKVIEFVTMYGIMSIISFSGADSVASSIFDNFSTFFTSGFFVDGDDLSILVNLFAAPVFLAIVAITVIISLVIEAVLILVFKKLYFKSGVEKEEKEKLYKYIKLILAGFVLVGFISAAALYGSLKWIIVYIMVYLPVPFFVFIIVHDKFNRMYSDNQ